MNNVVDFLEWKTQKEEKEQKENLWVVTFDDMPDVEIYFDPDFYTCTFNPLTEK